MLVFVNAFLLYWGIMKVNVFLECSYKIVIKILFICIKFGFPSYNSFNKRVTIFVGSKTIIKS